MVVGAFGAGAYGLSPRYPRRGHHCRPGRCSLRGLAARFPPPAITPTPAGLRDSIRLGIMFNIIDGSLGVKADLVPLAGVSLNMGKHFASGCAAWSSIHKARSSRSGPRPEDIIAWQIDGLAAGPLG